MVSPKIILVTGGAGFIGSHVTDRLLAMGHRVVVVDDLSSGKLQNLNRGAIFYHSSITQPAIEEIFHQERPHIVNHHAAQTSVSRSVQDATRDAEINVLGTIRLLEASRQFGVEKFIYASTGGAIYGEPEYNPCDEKHPIKPLSPYGLSKYIAERYLHFYHSICGLKYTVLRYGNVYGPRQDPYGEAGVIAIFTMRILEGKQPVIYGNGEQERDFVFIDDVVEANILAMEKGDGEIFNIGTGQGTSVNRIFGLLKDIIRYRWKPIYESPRPGEVYKISLDFSKAKRGLGWEPQLTLEDGLHRTVDYFRKTLRTS